MNGVHPAEDVAVAVVVAAIVATETGLPEEMKVVATDCSYNVAQSVGDIAAFAASCPVLKTHKYSMPIFAKESTFQLTPPSSCSCD